MYVSALLGAVGIILLARYAERAASLTVRPPALLGVLLTACGTAYAAALRISPARHAVRLRHIAAGAAAAWLAYVASGVARRLGLPPDADGFRVFWAPCVEELAKALMLAVVWTFGDDRRDRREIVAAAVGVGAGFALRENFTYFGEALGASGIYLEWIVLRALPPVLAHAAFAMISGGAVAQRVLHARALGEASPRFSVLGLVVAVLAHVTFNFVALVITRAAGTYAVEVTALWSAVAIVVAWLLQRRVVALAALDETAVASLVPPIEHPARVVAGVLAIVTVCWLVPSGATRYFAAVLTPVTTGLALAFAVSWRLRVPRVMTAVLLGVLLRPIVHAPELMLTSLSRLIHAHRSLRLPVGLLANVVWLAPIAATTYAVTRTRGRRAALVLALGITAGLVGASLGGALVNSPLRRPGRAAMEATLPLVPFALALGALAGRVAYRSLARLGLACIAVPALALAVSEVERHFRPGWVHALTTATLSLAALAAVMIQVEWQVRREAREGAVAQTS